MSFRSVISNLSMGAFALASASALTSPAHAAAPESNDPIKIALFDWTSVNLNAKILGGILEKLGYTVEYPTADYLSSLTTGLTNGDLDVGLEFWDTTAGEAMKASDATGQTERLGKLGPKAKEEWWFPEYMKEKCPGLPNWEALKDPKCAEAFSTAETAPKGRYLGGPVTWEGFDDERVEALKLPFTVIHAGTDAAMFAELELGLSAQGADHAVDLFAALGAGQVQGRVGCNSPNTRPSATPIRNGASTPTPNMIAASRMARSGNTPGPA